MDPDANWAIVKEGDSPVSRVIAAVDLLVWIAKGGALPKEFTTGSHADAVAEITEVCQRRVFDLVDRFDVIEDVVPKAAVEAVGEFLTARDSMGNNVDLSVIHEVWVKKEERHILRTDDVRAVTEFARFVGEGW